MAIHIDNVVEETNRRTGRDSEMDNKVQARKQIGVTIREFAAAWVGHQVSTHSRG
jgi:hypothetical protein